MGAKRRAGSLRTSAKRCATSLAAEVAQERKKWAEEEAALLAAAHRAAFEDFETRCAQAVANILRPFLIPLAIGRVTGALVENLETLFASRTRALFEISGPADLLEALREKFADRDAAIAFKPEETIDVRVRLDDTVIETQLEAWMTALGALPQGAEFKPGSRKMADDAPPEIIIVRRRVVSEEAHHGGAWKIAYADFVTAMMAFFLVLWILNSTNKDSQTIIARYFNPVKMEDFAKNKKGIRESQKEEKPGTTDGEIDKTPPAGPQQGKIEEKGKEPNKDINAKSLMNEETLFQNPYAALDQIAGKLRSQDKSKEGKGAAGGSTGETDAYRDPFRTSGAAPDDDDVAAGSDLVRPETAPVKSVETLEKAGEPAAKADLPKAAAEAVERESARADELKKEIATAMKPEASKGDGSPGPRLDVQATARACSISLTDSENFGMFEIGSSAPNPKLVHLMDRIAQSLKTQPGAIVLRGHTDGRRYRNGLSDNWRLSASRAQMALYMLVRGGLPESRIERVEGYADQHLKLADKPEAAENRRIEILLRKAAP